FNDNQRLILKLLLTGLIIFDWLNSYGYAWALEIKLLSLSEILSRFSDFAWPAGQGRGVMR
ncbi:MAG: hypothetical protein K2J66_05420, partial [Muribaculaceae bacterium]|nr:hypothetical protein [Muribaculaceae bacterium]